MDPKEQRSSGHRFFEWCLPCAFGFVGNCRRNPENGIAACTRKACAVYAKPYCLDDKATAAETGGTPMAQTVKYACDGGKSFTVSHSEYRSGDQRLKLKQDQVMFSDHQSHTAMPLERVRSASGEQYSDGKLSLFAKGDEAFVKVEGKMHYSNCQRQG